MKKIQKSTVIGLEVWMCNWQSHWFQPSGRQQRGKQTLHISTDDTNNPIRSTSTITRITFQHKIWSSNHSDEANDVNTILGKNCSWNRLKGSNPLLFQKQIKHANLLYNKKCKIQHNLSIDRSTRPLNIFRAYAHSTPGLEGPNLLASRNRTKIK